jgi:hypothetical protein
MIKLCLLTDHGDPQSCDKLRLPHFLGNWLKDGSEFVSPMRRPPFNLKKIPGTHLCWRLCRPQGNSAAGRIR